MPLCSLSSSSRSVLAKGECASLESMLFNSHPFNGTCMFRDKLSPTGIARSFQNSFVNVINLPYFIGPSFFFSLSFIEICSIVSMHTRSKLLDICLLDEYIFPVFKSIKNTRIDHVTYLAVKKKYWNILFYLLINKKGKKIVSDTKRSMTHSTYNPNG